MDTSASFLESLRHAPEDGAWAKLVDLYSPLIRGWLKRRGTAESDVDDVAQDVMAVVVRRFPEFRRQPHTGSFRAWLRKITVNCLRDHWRRDNRQPFAVGGTDFGAIVDQLEDPHSELSRLWDREHDEHVTQYLLSSIRAEFSEKTWILFQRFAIDGLNADEVAAEHGTTANAVFIAKSRVMAMLRERGKGLID
ncbi:MAG: sigma-70 family RNA polymerase sigma factor [Planctomycetaceae bacterium]|nr:sigma-70 family RNA polymerase sigma factor [Planctomycetales bacterium]MCB9922867.1 sigma-70 family RNA polymerase sigma factor [Planctomycetaceae bacterium]